MIRYKRARLDDYAFLFQNLREEDKNEIFASGKTLKQSSVEAHRYTDVGYAVYKDDKLLCIFGYRENSFLGNKATPWLLGTKYLNPDDYEIKKEFLRASKRFVRKWQRHFSLLENYVDARYTKAIRWIEWLGFHIEEPKKHPITGYYFSKFWIKGGS